MSTDPKRLIAPLQFKKPALIINMGSGSTTDISVPAAALFETKGYTKPAIHKVGPEDLMRCLADVAQDGTDLLVIYGGDGTCRAGAIAAQDANIPFVALPGGTMNLLPKALYGTTDWAVALELALDQKTTRWQAAGRVNDRAFFCGAILGDPIVMSEARETVREDGVIEGVKHITEVMTAVTHGDSFEYCVNGTVFDRTANVLQVSCPYMSKGATDPTRFELASAPQLTLRELLGIGAFALVSDWRESPDVLITHTANVEISGQGEFDILLDGETDTVSCPILFALDSQGVEVLAPNLHDTPST